MRPSFQKHSLIWWKANQQDLEDQDIGLKQEVIAGAASDYKNQRCRLNVNPSKKNHHTPRSKQRGAGPLKINNMNACVCARDN